MSAADASLSPAAGAAVPSAATPARAAWRIDWIAVPRLHLAILAALSLLLAVFASANIQYVPESSDTRTNFEVGVNFGETGVLGPSPVSVGWHMREPFVPVLIGAYHVVRGALGLATAPLSCLPFDAQQTIECQQLTAPYRHINVAFIVLAAFCAFLLVHGTVGSAVPAYAAWFATGTSTMLFNGLQRFVTEGPTAALMALSAVLLCMLLARRRAWQAVALGLCLAALTLTKIVFAYFWVVVAAILVALALLERRTSLRLAGLAALMAVAHLSVTGVWMTRNYLQADYFRLMDGRSYRVLSVRSSYNEMRMDEWLTGFVYFLPLFNERQVEAMGFPRSSFERFNSANDNSFRKVGQERYRVARREEIAKAKAEGVPPPVDRHVYEVLSRKFSRMLLAEPVAHLRVSVLLAYIATFPETGYGVTWFSKAGRLGDAWSLRIPALGYAMSPLQITLLNGATTLAILVLPFALFLRNRNIGGLVIALPVLYSHGVYAVASHFIVRYARPEIPLRNVALCILVWLAVAGAVRLLRGRLPGRGGARAIEAEEAM